MHIQLHLQTKQPYYTKKASNATAFSLALHMYSIETKVY